MLLSCFEAYPENCAHSTEARLNGLNMADLCEKKIEVDKTESMLLLGFSKLFKVLIMDKNMEMFMEDATMKILLILFYFFIYLFILL